MSSELITYVRADITKFTQGISSATKQAESFSVGAVKSLDKLKLAFAGLGAAALVGGLKQAFDGLDDLGAVANKLDITTQSLQGLQYAAKRSDVEFGTLENGLQRLRKRIGEAVNGNKSAADSFRKLGLDAKALASVGIDAAYLDVADAISKVTSSTEQASAATDVFGKAGQEQLNAIRNNIRGLVSEAGKLGFILSDDDIKKFDKLDEAVDKLAFSLKTELYKTLLDLGPALTATGHAFSATISFIRRDLAAGQSQTTDYIERFAKLQNWVSSKVNGFEIFDPLKGYTMEDFRKSGKSRTAATNNQTTQGGANSAAESMIKASKNLNELGTSAATAASALSAISTTKLQDLLGINDTSGKSYLDSILTKQEEVTDPYFTKLANQLRDNIRSGTRGFGLNNESILANLRNWADDIVPGEGQTKNGMLNAIKALEDASQNLMSEGKQEVTVELKYDQEGFIKAFINNSSVGSVVDNAVRRVTTSEAQSTIAFGG